MGKLFLERKGTVYFGIHHTEDNFDLVMVLLATRLSVKDISRIMEIDERTINNWAVKAAEFLKKVHESFIKDLEITECQIDEMWTFVLMKRKTASLKGLENNVSIGEQWIFIAIDAVTKLLLHWKIGKRTLEVAKLFIGELKEKLASNPLFTTDEFAAYEEAFLSNFCNEIKPEPTGKRGRPRTKVKKVPLKELKLAQVHKTRENGKVIDISQKIVFGEQEEIFNIINSSPVSNIINTSIVERQNGTVRSRNPKVVRKTYSFSKKLEMLKAHMTIYFVFYNFIWLHSRHKKTAAWKHGIVNHKMTFKELFEIRHIEFNL